MALRLGQKAGQNLGQTVRIAEVTFPDDQNFPAQSAELAENAAVAIAIALSLGLPEFCICARNDAAVSTAMHVPETTVKGAMGTEVQVVVESLGQFPDRIRLS